jgi:GcrA cell cycle regulator
MENKIMDWNEERTATLRKLWLEGMSASQVARQLGGVSRSAVIGKVHRLGITVREVPTRSRTVVRTASRAQPRARIARETVPSAAPRQAIRLAPIVEMAPTESILGLSTHSCRWPIGDVDSHDFGFCGREKTARASYCEDHARGAFRKLASPSQVKAWTRQPAARVELHTA